MLRSTDNVGYAIWDDKDHIIPEEFRLDANSTIQEALKVFYAAGGYDFFKVTAPEKYASNWLDFIGSLYSDIVGGKFGSDAKHYTVPLTENERLSLIEQGVPEIFTKGSLPASGK